MKTIFIEFLTVLLLIVTTSVYGASTDHAGIVKSLSGEVNVLREGHVIKATPNFKLQVGDVIQTGTNGKTGLILEDDTVISMGFNSRIAIKSFIFQPNEKKLSLVATVFRGTISFLSGQIAKLAPDLVRIEIPHATVGIRGTHVLVQVDE